MLLCCIANFFPCFIVGCIYLIIIIALRDKFSCLLKKWPTDDKSKSRATGKINTLIRSQRNVCNLNHNEAVTTLYHHKNLFDNISYISCEFSWLQAILTATITPPPCSFPVAFVLLSILYILSLKIHFPNRKWVQFFKFLKITHPFLDLSLLFLTMHEIPLKKLY